MDKRISVILIFAIMFSLVICLIFSSKNIVQESDNISESINTPEPLADDDFIIKDDNTFIKLNDEYTNLKTKENIENISEPHFTCYLYSYKNFSLMTDLEEPKKMFKVIFLTNLLVTSRGIHIGSSIDNVLEKYGNEYTNISGGYMYSYNNKFINFFIDENGKVNGIDFNML